MSAFILNANLIHIKVLYLIEQYVVCASVCAIFLESLYDLRRTVLRIQLKRVPIEFRNTCKVFSGLLRN